MLRDGPRSGPTTLVLAHGAGAPMDSPFMNAMAQGVAACGHHVVRFEFDYMAARRRDGRKRPPARQAALLAEWNAVIDGLGGGEAVFIGGKSMGGRMASLIAAERPVRGLVCLGYPFHPPGKPAATRTEHLHSLLCPGFIVQGSRDPFGKQSEVENYDLGKRLSVHWIDDGDHDLKPRKSSGLSVDDAWNNAVGAVDGFLKAAGAPAPS